MTVKSKHQAIVLIKVEAHDVLSTGECSGNPVPASTLSEYGLKPTESFSISGEDRDDCLRKLKEKIDVFRK